MAFRIEGGFDPGAILARQELPPDPQVMQANALKLQAAQQEQSLFPLKKESAELGVQNDRLALQERQRNFQEAQVMQQTFGDPKYRKPDGTVDYPAAMGALAGKVHPKTLQELQTFMDTHGEKVSIIAKNTAEADKMTTEAQKEEGQFFSDMAADLQSPDKYTPQNVAMRLSAVPPKYAQHGKQLWDAYQADPESFQTQLANMITPATKERLQKQAESKAQQAKNEAETSKINAETPGAQAKSDIEVATANSLKSMTDADWKAAIDNTVEDQNSPLYRRTMAQVQFYRSKGDLKGASDAIKLAGEQLGKTESAVATARATAPIKIDVAAATANAAGNAAEKSGALDIMAEQALAGQFQSRNPQMLARVYGRAAELAQDRGMTSRQVVMEQNAAKASQQAYTGLVKNYETLKPFAEMAERNATVLEQKVAQVSNLGGSFWNTPLRNLESRFAGNADVAAYRAALMPVQADFARILNSPTAAGALTDDSRHEMQQALKDGATPGEVRAALDVFRTDARNRKEEYEKTIGDLKGRTVSPGGQQGTFGVKDPRGVTHAFKTQADADAFKKAAGIQ
jgi:hypothetical protein